MTYYILTFAISLFAIHMAEKSYSQKPIFVLFSIFALAPPVLLAGFRDHTIGADTDFYILPIFYQASRYFKNFSDLVWANPNTDYLYLLYTWGVTRLTDESYIFLSVNHIVILFPMYVAAFIFRKYLSPVLFFLIYYLVFYQDSLSIVRQSFAISFSTLAFAYYMSKKYKKYIFFMALAFGFHSTVVLTLVYPLLLWFLNKYPLKENTIKYGLFLIVGIAVVVNLDFLLLLLINLGAINAKYLIYTSESEVFKGGLGVTNFIVKFVIIFFVYSYRKVHKKTLFIDFAYVLSIMDMMLCLFALLMEPLDRFALYPRLMSCITLPILFKACSKKNTFLQIQKYGLILFLIAYWCYVYMWGDYGSTANYKFVLM